MSENRKVVCMAFHGIGTYQRAARDDRRDPADFDYYMWQAAQKGVGYERMGTLVIRDGGGFDIKGDVIWQPVLWSQDKLEKRQIALGQGRPGEWGQGFKFAVSALADAASYQFFGRESPFTPGSNYSDVQHTIYQYLARLEHALIEADIDPMQTPIVVFAQSMGCHVLSSYAWDAQRHPERINHEGEVSAFCKLETLASVVFTGCNIPILTMGIDPGQKIPLRIPKRKWGGEQVWRSFYDLDDVLGYPIEPEYAAWFKGEHPAHARLGTAESGKVTRNPDDEVQPEDVPIELGRGMSIVDQIQAWSPAAHLLYWKDRRVIRAAGHAVKSLLGD